MRVLHVAEPTTGGVPTYLDRIAAQQVATGVDVDVLQPLARDHPAGVVQHSWPLDRSKVSTYAGALRSLHALLQEVRPDVLHLHSFVAGVAGRLPTGRSPEHATVYQPHAWATDRFGGLASAAVQRWERSAGGRTEVLVTNCDDEVDQGRSLGVATPAVSVGVPIDVTHFRPPDHLERQVARTAVGFGSRSVVLVVGRLGYQKGHDLIVSEWERAPIPGSELVLLGGGDAHRVARLAPHEWERSIRHVASTVDVRPWLWAADVVAVPSRYETVSLVLAEAMAVGTSVVTTRFSGAAEAMLAGGEPAGHLVEQGDMCGLLAACRERLKDPDGFARERVNGPRRVSRLFTVDAVTARLDRAYAMAAARRGSGLR